MTKANIKKRTDFQDYLGEFYSERKKPLYYSPKLTNPLGKFANEMFVLLEKGDFLKLQDKVNEMQVWKGMHCNSRKNKINIR